MDGEKRLIVEHAGATEAIAFDEILCAVGRVANTAGYGLEALGIPTTPSRTVEVNGFLETRFPNILACGDVAGPYQFTHTASHMAWFASVNALFGRFRKFRVDYTVVPWATFTEPEVARVGVNEQEARAAGVPFTVTTYGIDDLDRAIADGAAEGLVKVLTDARHRSHSRRHHRRRACGRSAGGVRDRDEARARPQARCWAPSTPIPRWPKPTSSPPGRGSAAP